MVKTEPTEREKREEASNRKFEKKYNEDSTSDVFDVNNAYMDLSVSKYQEKLISKIIEDPKINDKHQFLTKLITRVNSQEPEKFIMGTQESFGKHGTGYTNSQTNLTYQN